MATQRLSAIQKNTLFLLYALQQRQGDQPVPASKLLGILNKNGSTEIHGNNFRASCRTMAGNQLINVYRERIYLAYSLTEAGLQKAQEIYGERNQA